jgi:hypothetical protein
MYESMSLNNREMVETEVALLELDEFEIEREGGA